MLQRAHGAGRNGTPKARARIGDDRWAATDIACATARNAFKCNQAFGAWAPGACTARGTRGAAGRARAQVQQAEAQRHLNGLTRVLHTCHAKWRESGVNVPLSTARKRHEHAARARQGVRHKRSLCTLQKLIGLDRPVLAAPQLEPWRACNLLRSRGDLSLLAEAKLLRRASGA